MVITLESPFKNLYRKAYIREDSKGRRRVDLINNSKDRTTISYARYLMCINIGYILDKAYEVDHIDGDCNNDDISNLQILTKEEHLKKTTKEVTTGRSVRTLSCICCGKDFEREVRNIRNSRSICSRSCNGKLSTNLKAKSKALTYEEVLDIRSLFVKGDKVYGIAGLARLFGVSKNTLSKAIYDEDYAL